MLPRAPLPLLFALLPACSGSPGSTAAGSAGDGARAALTMHVYPAVGQTCGVLEHTANVPELAGVARTVTADTVAGSVSDGSNGAVTCRVTPSATGWMVSARIASGPYTFEIDTLLDAAGAGTGTVSEKDSDVNASIASTASMPCTFTTAAQTGESYSVAPGRAWGTFSCAGLADPASPADACSATGWFALEACEK